MASSLGRLLLLKVGDGVTPVEGFTNYCGFKARSFRLNNELIDTSVPDCDNPGNPVLYNAQYGIQQLSFSGSGESSDDVQNKLLLNAAREQTALNCQVIVPGWGTFEGAVRIGSFEFSGDVGGNMEFTCEVSFVGAITFTPEP